MTIAIITCAAAVVAAVLILLHGVLSVADRRPTAMDDDDQMIGDAFRPGG